MLSFLLQLVEHGPGGGNFLHLKAKFKEKFKIMFFF